MASVEDRVIGLTGVEDQTQYESGETEPVTEASEHEQLDTASDMQSDQRRLDHQPSTVFKFANIFARRASPMLLWFSILGLGIVGVAVTAAVYIFIVPAVWNWGFSPPVWWKMPMALFFELFIVVLGVYPVVPSIVLGNEAIKRYVANEEARRSAGITKIVDEQATLEKELVALGNGSIVKVLRMSRLELEKWNRTTLSQNRRSFFYAVMAMWIGFGILTMGVLSSFGLFAFDGGSPIAINVVVLASGAIVELISALFLWVYRSSLEYFRYFYDQQMTAYQTLMAFDISGSMSNKDEARLLIVRQLLENVHSVPSQPQPSLIRRRSSKKAS